MPEVERPKLDRLSTHVVEKVKYQPKSSINLQKISDNQPLAQNVDAMKQCPNLSYFAKWRFSFPYYVM